MFFSVLLYGITLYNDHTVCRAAPGDYMVPANTILLKIHVETNIEG